MEQHIVKVKSVEKITHDVLHILTEKPERYYYLPGQATEISINKPGWTDERRPFTFICLPDHTYLEFAIKTYPERHSVTDQLLQLKKDDELILHEVFGTIGYKGEGLFIAGGAGITPFICIFRQLQATNKIGNNNLIFANKTRNDIILEREFKKMLGNNFINILSDEKAEGIAHGMITQEFLKEHIGKAGQKIYICGPDPMMDAISMFLANMDIDEKLIIKEAF